MFNGANDIEVISGHLPRERVSHRWLVRRHPSTGRESLFKSNETKSAVPHNFTVVKGLAYCSFSRQFVDFALRSPYARNLLQWARDTYSPDEWYLAAPLALPNLPTFLMHSLISGTGPHSTTTRSSTHPAASEVTPSS